jgi:hypothetical protein
LRPDVNNCMYYHQLCVVLRVFACCRNRKFILVSYREEYNFMLRVTYVTVSDGCHDRNNVSFESRNWLLHLLSLIMCYLTWTLLVVATGSLCWFDTTKTIISSFEQQLSTNKVIDFLNTTLSNVVILNWHCKIIS